MSPDVDPRDLQIAQLKANLAELEAKLRAASISPVGRTQGQLGVCQAVFKGLNPNRPGVHQCDRPIDHEGSHSRKAPEGRGPEFAVNG